MRPRIEKEMPQHVRKKRPDMSPAYLALIRQLPCLACGRRHPNDPHHLMRVGHGPNTRGLSYKNADKWAVPACRKCHDAIPSHDDEWFAERGIDARAVATALWACRNEPHALEAMRRIIFRARQGAMLKEIVP